MHFCVRDISYAKSRLDRRFLVHNRPEIIYRDEFAWSNWGTGCPSAKACCRRLLACLDIDVHVDQ